MRLSDFKVLSFDCYGTLIDWESGIWAALQALAMKAGGKEREAALIRFGHHESAQERETPSLKYSALLSRVHARLAAEWGVAHNPVAAAVFGASVGDWPAFPDSAEALAYLKRHFKLVILSNVDGASFAGSNARLGVEFDAICTAEDVGSYKPNPANFRYLLARLGEMGNKPRELLHVAQSLYHDHVPANAAGLSSAWIDRRAAAPGWGATPEAAARYDFRFATLAELADAHRAEQAGR
ncbi:MAG TPA: haloacid dehalogenase type II [Stellaceae bacterium]|jgi:2-haloacid dehalogenase|nr:haloacid dehalogenase type II [Stellaceae bacterium]